MAVPTFTKAGTKAATPAKLDKAVFEVEVKNHDLLKEAYLSYLAEGRSNNAVAKKRGEVRGGGRKPWQQKGTGRARFGSSRNPIWRGGGAAFGPTGNENYTRKVSTSIKRQALKQALSLANSSGKLIIIEEFTVKSAKTKDAAALLAKVGAKGNILLAVDNITPELSRAVKNLAGVRLVQSTYLNVYDVLNSDFIVFTKSALEFKPNTKEAASE